LKTPQAEIPVAGQAQLEKRDVRNRDPRRTQDRCEGKRIFGGADEREQRSDVHHFLGAVKAAATNHSMGDPQLAQRLSIDLEKGESAKEDRNVSAPRWAKHAVFPFNHRGRAGILKSALLRVLRRVEYQPVDERQSRACQPAGELIVVLRSVDGLVLSLFSAG
jgi:hypothetical protein